MIKHLQLLAMLKRREPRFWCDFDWRKINGKIVKFINYKAR